MGNSNITKQNILDAAEVEFSQKGISGARIDEIALKANVNKRMIYAYFENKENLYKTVLCEVYSRLSLFENVGEGEESTRTDLIKNVIRKYFYFLQSNPSFVNLVLWENLNECRYMDDDRIRSIKQPGMSALRRILTEGIATKEFREGIDIEQVVFSMNMFCFAYFSNKYTMSRILNIQSGDEDNIENRIEYVSDVILMYISAK